MRARIGVPLVLVVSTLLAGVIGTGAATGRTVLHLVLPAHAQRVQTIDQYENGLRLGDRVAARGRLNDSDGTRAGTAYGDCLVHRPIKGPETGLWTCTYVLELGDGDIVVKGLDPRGPGEYEMAVLGGTGAYANAAGDATFTDVFGETGEVGQTDMVIRLSS